MNFRNLALLLFLLAIFSAAGRAATINAASCSSNDVQNAINSAVNGDAVDIPAGTCTWATTVAISKAITLQGAGSSSTHLTNSVSGGSYPAQLIRMTLVAGYTSRITGIHFAASGLSADGGASVMVLGSSDQDGSRFRFDHNVVNDQPNYALWLDGVLGVADHNDFGPMDFGHLPFEIQHNNWGGSSNGDGSWAVSNQFGTDKFFFIENNTFVSNSAIGDSLIDCLGGARYVVRYNTGTNVQIETHGTESGQRQRGCRAIEVYNNIFQGAIQGGQWVDMRSGTALVHDNTLNSLTYSNAYVHLQTKRLVYPFTPWGQANGQNTWDNNVVGGPFDNGTATGGGSLGLVDAAKNWTTGQWANNGYVVVKGGCSGYCGSQIVSNTAATLTLSGNGGYASEVSFSNGNTYQIWRVSEMLDQAGKGEGSLVSGASPTLPGGWYDQADDPIYVWNNTIPDSSATISYAIAHSTIRANEHYYPIGTSKPGYTPYTYPHPLVTGAVVPPINDTTQPSQVTGLTATAVSQSQINLAWNTASDNIGVAGYIILRGGVNIDNSTATSYSNTGLATGTTYSYTVAAYDASGNTGVQSTSASVTTLAPDTTAPTVSISSPSGTIFGTVTLTAIASDNIAIFGVQFRVDGTNIDSEDVSSPYSVSWNSETVGNGTHSVTAVARDAAGNSATSSAVNVNVQNAAAVIPTNGLIAHWKFNEATGTSASDASGNGVTGALTNGPVWIPGKIGNALSLDGSNDYVLLNNNLIGAQNLTVCAWIFQRSPATTRFNNVMDNTKFYISVDTYFQPSLSMRAGNDGSVGAASGSFQSDAWNHFCFIRNVSAGTFYVNSLLSGTANQNIGIPSASGFPAAIGQYSSLGGNNFYGNIDELRIYDRVLSQAEVQQLYQESSSPYSGMIVRGKVTKTGGNCVSCPITISINGISGSATTSDDGTFTTVISTTFPPGNYVADITITDGAAVKQFKKRIVII